MLMVLLLALSLSLSLSMEPVSLGPLVKQSLWQAAEPVGVTVSYDVPVWGAGDLKKAIERRKEALGFLSKATKTSATIRSMEATAEDLTAMKSDVDTAMKHLDGDDDMQRAGLSRLLTLMNTWGAQEYMLLKRVTVKVKNLMLIETTSDEIRGLCGSVLTHLTNLPVASETLSKDDGNAGHINIVLPRLSRVYEPDKEILAMPEQVRELM